MSIDLQFLNSVKAYIEKSEQENENERGSGRPVENLIAAGFMPKLYLDVLALIENASVHPDIDPKQLEILRAELAKLSQLLKNPALEFDLDKGETIESALIKYATRVLSETTDFKSSVIKEARAEMVRKVIEYLKSFIAANEEYETSHGRGCNCGAKGSDHANDCPLY